MRELAQRCLQRSVIILTYVLYRQINILLRHMALIQILPQPLSAPLFMMELYKMNGISVIIQIMKRLNLQKDT